MVSAGDAELIASALQAYDLGPLRTAVHHAGTAARTWRLTTASGEYLLRTRGSRTSAAELIAYDHALRRHLLAAGIPTAAPLATREGSTTTRVGERALELYAIVPGAPLAAAGLAEIAAAARALAAFHAAAASFPLAQALPPVAQYRTLGLEQTSQRMEDPALLQRVYAGLAATAGTASQAPALALAQAWLERLRRHFSATVYSHLPQTVTHGDFTLANLLFLEGQVSGIFDFDWARWAPRLRDLADGMFFIAGERRTPLVAADIWSLTEAAQLSVPRCARWLRSYDECAPLRPDELACLPLALAARWLSVRVEGMAKVPEAERRRFALGNLAAPLEWLDRHWPEVLAALHS
jgi:Ser/Thr protein kinase RdoA (MazF antagonist)